MAAFERVLSGIPESQVWDSHVHLFPPEIYKNWEKYACMDPWFGKLTKTPQNGRGTAEAWADAGEALSCADEAGVYGLVMQGWYWNDAGLMRMHNDYMAEVIKKYPDRIRAFVSVNPKFKNQAVYEIERCIKMGFCGIGELGPGGNGYDFEDRDFLDVIAYAGDYQLPVCIHCGEAVGHPYPGKDMTPLGPLAEVILKNQNVTFILAHLGGGMPFFEMGRRYNGKFDHVYYDTAANPLLYHIRALKAVIQLAGAGRILFGSDFPLLLYPSKKRTMDMKMFVDDIYENAGLSIQELRQVMGQNLLNLLAK